MDSGQWEDKIWQNRQARPVGLGPFRRFCSVTRAESRQQGRLSREGIRHLAKLDLGRDREGSRGAGAWPDQSGCERRRFHRHHRAQPALFLLGDGGGAIGRCDAGAALSGQRRRRDGLCDGPLRRPFAVVEDQEQVDKVIEIQDSLHQFEHMIYIDPRGLRKYDHPQAAPVQPMCRNRAARPMTNSSPI